MHRVLTGQEHNVAPAAILGELGANGKQDVLIRHLMSHASGAAGRTGFRGRA